MFPVTLSPNCFLTVRRCLLFYLIFDDFVLLSQMAVLTENQQYVFYLSRFKQVCRYEIQVTDTLVFPIKDPIF